MCRERSASAYKWYAFCFLLAFSLCWFFPYTGDDWKWGSQIGLDVLAVWFDGEDGRYVGNLLVLALTRSNLLKALVMAACHTAVPVIIHRSTRAPWAFAVAAALLLCAPQAIFREVFVWTSGFANFATSATLSLVYIAYVYGLFRDPAAVRPEALRHKPLHAAALFVLGALCCMIVEHVTVFNVIFSLFIVVYVFLRYRRWTAQHVGFFLGCVLGAVCMFSNSVYSGIPNGGDEYYFLATSSYWIPRMVINNYFGTIYAQFHMKNLVLNAAIVAACVRAYLGMRSASVGVRRSIGLCLAVNCAYCVYAVISGTALGSEDMTQGLRIAEGVFTAVHGAALIAAVCLAAHHYGKLPRFLFLIGCILLPVLPLFLVMPIGARCFYFTYVLFIWLFVEIMELRPLSGAGALLPGSAAAVLAVLLAFYFFVFTTISSAEESRLAHIRSEVAQGHMEIEVLGLPYSGFLHHSSPDEDSNLAMRYKLFYGIPQDTVFHLVESYSE